MAKKLAIGNGTYVNKAGETKTRWVNIGVILEKDGKEFMLLDPTINLAGFQREQGKDMLMVGIFQDQPQQQNQGYQQPPQQNQQQGQQYNQNQPPVEYQDAQGQPQQQYQGQNQQQGNR